MSQCEPPPPDWRGPDEQPDYTIFLIIVITFVAAMIFLFTHKG